MTSLELAGPGLKQSSAHGYRCRFQYAIPKASFRVPRLIDLELQATLDESTREGFAPVRQQLTAYSHAQLGAIAIKEGDYREALRWYRMADDEQTRFGGKWIPDLDATRKKLEIMVGSSSDR